MVDGNNPQASEYKVSLVNWNQKKKKQNSMEGRL